MKTLVFCTAWAESQQIWQLRYRKWLQHIRDSTLSHDQILIVDDGSVTLPDFSRTIVIDAERLPPSQPAEETVFAHFAARLGRKGTFDYPGWWRSFMFAAQYATRYEFDRVVHVESDAFILSTRLCETINSMSQGWHVFWCPFWGFPESCLQVIGGAHLDSYENFSKRSYDAFVGRPVEDVLPYTHVEKAFKGDRYGDYATELPRDADYAANVPMATAVWHDLPPPRRRLICIAIGSPGSGAAEAALYPGDSWEMISTVEANSVHQACEEIAQGVGTCADAVQLKLEIALDVPSMTSLLVGTRLCLADGGEFAIRCNRPIAPNEAADLAQALLANGFQMAAGAGRWLIARADRDSTPRVCLEELFRVRVTTASRL